MLEILEELKKGSTEIGPNYQKCVEMWSEVLNDASELSVSELAERLTFQLQMEQICGGRLLGKTVMAVSGFHYLHDREAGFRDPQLAEKLLQAFGRSGVSIEVNWMVQNIVAKMFHIK